MNRAEWTYAVLFITVVLLAPMIPTDVLLLLDQMIVRLLSIVIVLFSISQDPILGLLSFIAIGALYLERNRRKVDHALKRLEEMDVYADKKATIEESATPQKTVPVRPFDNPDEQTYDFLPADTDGDEYNYDSSSDIQPRATLSSIYPGGPQAVSSSEGFYESMGVGHVKGVETLGNE